MTTQYWKRWCWLSGLVGGLVVEGAIASTMNSAVAQMNLTPDTAGDRNLGTRVEALSPTVDQIRGGTQRGSNLFHSFSEFNIPENRAVYFENPGNVGRILTRITGTDPSDIEGRLGVGAPGDLGAADLFLINPNGIIFGPDASLDIGGSFVATTADAIQFGDQGFFSATDPNTPPLLTVQPSALLFNQMVTQPNALIRNEGDLSVQPNQNLSLIGGNIVLDGGQLNALDGHVELASVSGAGTVALGPNDGSPQLVISDDVSRADVVLTNDSQVDVRGTGLGSIAVNAGKLEISGASQLLAGVATTPLLLASQPGDITIDTTESLILTGAVRRSGVWDRSSIRNSVARGAVGEGGDIEISTGALQVTGGAEIATSIAGQGGAGDIRINARDSFELLSGETQNNSFASSRVQSGLEGGAIAQRGGDIWVGTGSLNVTDGAFITASTSGRGDAGNVTIDGGNVRFSGVGRDVATGAYSQVLNNGNGQGGNVNVRADSLVVRDGAVLSTSIFSSEPGQRNAGNVSIDAQTVVFEGERRSPAFLHSGAYSQVSPGGVGNSGRVTVEADQFELRSGGLITTSTNGLGDAGDIQIDARAVRFFGVSESRLISSGVYSRVRDNAEGQGGNIAINAETFELRDGGIVTTSTRSTGDAGNISINAERMIFDGQGQLRIGSRDLIWPSGIFSTVERSGVGKGGTIRLTTDSLFVTNGGAINTGTFGRGGNAGNIVIEARGLVVFDGRGFGNTASTANSRTERFGSSDRSGRLSIRAESLEITGGAGISTSTSGNGDAGDIQIDVRDRVLVSGSGGGIFSQLIFGTRANSGRITITGRSVDIRDGAVLRASTHDGQGGRIQITALDSVTLSGFGRVASRLTTGTSGSGDAGDIIISTQELTLDRGAYITSNTFRTGSAGRIIINATDSVHIDGSEVGPFDSISRIEAESRRRPESEVPVEGDAGSIRITTGHLSVQNAGRVVVSSQDEANAGDLIIRADSIRLNNQARVSANTESGRGANIQLRVLDTLRLRNDSQISALTQDGFGGRLTLNNDQDAANRVEVSSNSSISTEAIGTGDAGSLALNMRQLQVNNGRVSASTQTGRAGSLRIRALDSIELSGEGGLLVQAEGTGGIAGDLSVRTGRFTVQDGASATVSSPAGQAGNLNVTANDIRLNQGSLTAETGLRQAEGGAEINLQNLNLLVMEDNSQISAEAFENANGGNVSIDAEDGFVIALPNQDSNIIARADRGDGGNINIAAQSIFNLEERREQPITNDIDASSRAGLPGSVTILEPNIDPSRGLAELPDDVVDASDQIAQTCPTGGSVAATQGEFIITGRGGLPPSPDEIHSTDGSDVDLVTPSLDSDDSSNEAESTSDPDALPNQIVEAQGWSVDDEGKVALVATMPTTLHQSWSECVR